VSKTIHETFWEKVLLPEIRTRRLLKSLKTECPDIAEELQKGVDASKTIIKRLIRLHKQNFPDAKTRNENEI